MSYGNVHWLETCGQWYGESCRNVTLILRISTPLCNSLRKNYKEKTWSYGRWCRGPFGMQGTDSILGINKACLVVFCKEQRPCCRNTNDSAIHPTTPECAPTPSRDVVFFKFLSLVFMSLFVFVLLHMFRPRAYSNWLY